MKQFILFIDKEEHFGVTDIDETHLFLHSSDETIIQKIQARLDQLQEDNSFTATIGGVDL